MTDDFRVEFSFKGTICAEENIAPFIPDIVKVCFNIHFVYENTDDFIKVPIAYSGNETNRYGDLVIVQETINFNLISTLIKRAEELQVTGQMVGNKLSLDTFVQNITGSQQQTAASQYFVFKGSNVDDTILDALIDTGVSITTVTLADARLSSKAYVLHTQGTTLGNIKIRGDIDISNGSNPWMFEFLFDLFQTHIYEALIPV